MKPHNITITLHPKLVALLRDRAARDGYSSVPQMLREHIAGWMGAPEYGCLPPRKK